MGSSPAGPTIWLIMPNLTNISSDNKPCLNLDIINRIAELNDDPEWMLERRLAALERFLLAPNLSWGPSLAGLDLDLINFYSAAKGGNVESWEEVPAEIRQTFTDLNLPEIEQRSLGGLGAQYDTATVYHNLRAELSEQGVVFLGMDEALKKHEELVKQYFMTECVPVHDHRFTLLHAAVWRGGTFIYVPAGVKVTMPLQAYFRMNAPAGGQFEHTLIIAEAGSEVHYIEACSAPRYNQASLHAGCVEIIVKAGAKVKYSSIENWSQNTYNLNTKRAVVAEGGTIQWLNGNLGSGVTMLYPMSVLRGEGASSDYLGVAVAGAGQVQDTGHKVAIVAPNCKANVQSKSISFGGGEAVYRGLVKITAKGKGAKVGSVCDSLILNTGGKARAIPVIDCESASAKIAHEAKVGCLEKSAFDYLAGRGFEEKSAQSFLIQGFVSEITDSLPFEYALEFSKLLDLQN